MFSLTLLPGMMSTFFPSLFHSTDDDDLQVSQCAMHEPHRQHHVATELSGWGAAQCNAANFFLSDNC